MKKIIIIIVVGFMFYGVGCATFNNPPIDTYTVKRTIPFQTHKQATEMMMRAVEFISLYTEREIVKADNSIVKTEPTPNVFWSFTPIYRMEYKMTRLSDKIRIEISIADDTEIHRAEMNLLILEDYMKSGNLRVRTDNVMIW